MRNPEAPGGDWQLGSRRPLLVCAVTAAVLLSGCSATADHRPTSGQSTPAKASASSSRPSPTPSAPAIAYQQASGITVPPGFVTEIYASGLTHPTAMAYGPQGLLYVTEENGDIVTVSPTSTNPHLFASGFHVPLGLAWIGDSLYVSAQGQIDSLQWQNAASGPISVLVPNLPYGEHQQDNIVVGPDGRLYFGSGSSCDLCSEASPYSAAILSVEPNGSGLEVVASGTRNPYGLAFQPGTPHLYADVNGQDNLGSYSDPEPADMVVQVVQGHNYGWPNCWPDARHLTLMGSCQGVSPPAVYLAPHAAPTGMTFYTGSSFPSGYAGNLFIDEWGSNVGPGSGHNVVRVVLNGDGTAPVSQVTQFASGFQDPIADLVDPEGALLVADYGSGIIYRIQAEGKP